MTIGSPPNLAAVRSELGKTGDFYMDQLDARLLAQVSPGAGAPYQIGSFVGRSCTNFAVTIGNYISNWGYYSFGPAGAISPANFQSEPMKSAHYNSGSTQLSITMGGSVPVMQSYFYAALWRDFVGVGSSQPSYVTQSAATFSFVYNGSNTAWFWGGSLPSWPGLVGQTVTVQLIY